MNIYLPFKNFGKCVRSLDTQTLIRQRENAEFLLKFILYKCGEFNLTKKEIKYANKIEIEKNPFYLFWWNNGKPFGHALYRYLDQCNFELFNRKAAKLINLLVLNKLVKESKKLNQGYPPRPRRITTGYRIILLCRDTDFYKEKFFMTHKRHLETIEKLKSSKERFKFAKFLGLI